MAITSIFNDAFVLTWDFILTIVDAVTPSHPAGHVVPAGHPGAGGEWPEYVSPGEGDSRCACPMLNAMANHGILPHDGKNISFKTMNETIRSTYNFSPSFCYFVPNYIARALDKDYFKDTFDLEQISVRNDKGIEHDASLTREDVRFQPDQGKPHIPFINELLATASGKDTSAEDPENALMLTSDDLARYSAKRRTDLENIGGKLDFIHKMFGSSNSATLLRIVGGHVSDLRPFLIDERIPDKWEPAIRSRVGLTMARFNLTVLPLEFSTRKHMKALAKAKKSG
ncbi:Chloroperoxidase [Rhodocollybia butyracea]|uniref:Chloroperoxidase n=2 Tax=Fungi TaxID=4751 RepID=A0A9P5Q4X2_9AGAR|nr:Chloroperoxidase [Rhodocollybia butyracea]